MLSLNHRSAWAVYVAVTAAVIVIGWRLRSQDLVGLSALAVVLLAAWLSLTAFRKTGASRRPQVLPAWLAAATLLLTTGALAPAAVVPEGKNDPARLPIAESPAPELEPEPLWPVPTRAKLTAYADNGDADAESEIIAYIELFDSHDRPTACRCHVEYNLSYRGLSRGFHIYNADYGDFRHVEIGSGAFARQGFINSTIIEEGPLVMKLVCGREYDLIVNVTLQDQSVSVADLESYYHSC